MNPIMVMNLLAIPAGVAIGVIYGALELLLQASS